MVEVESEEVVDFLWLLKMLSWRGEKFGDAWRGPSVAQAWELQTESGERVGRDSVLGCKGLPSSLNPSADPVFDTSRQYSRLRT